MTKTDTNNHRRSKIVVVVRHGERLDYDQRAAGKNWVEVNRNKRPW